MYEHSYIPHGKIYEDLGIRILVFFTTMDVIYEKVKHNFEHFDIFNLTYFFYFKTYFLYNVTDFNYL